MEFGACCGADIDRVCWLKELGFDYAEGSCGQIAGLNDEQFDAYLERFKKIGFPMPVANGFIPGNVRLTGPNRNFKQIEDYLRNLFYRTDALHIKKIIFGSGGARRLDDSISREKGIEELTEVIRKIICPMAKDHDLQIVIEPLRIQECNILNTVRESIEFITKSGIENLHVLADIYHMVSMGESFDSLIQFKGFLSHAHISNPVLGEVRRVYPTLTDGYDQKPFIESIIHAGVDTCSIEAGTDDFYNDARNALPVLRNSVQ